MKNYVNLTILTAFVKLIAINTWNAISFKNSLIPRHKIK